MATKVSSSFIGNSAISAVHLAAGAVETAKIADSAVTQGKLADGAVVAAKLGSGAVGASALDTGAVTAAKIGAGAVEEAKIADGAVATAKIAAGAVTSAKIATGAVDTTQLADGAVTADKLDGAILSGVLATKLVGKSVMSMIESAPNATTSNVKTLLGFDVTAGVDGAGATKGKVALLEGTDINISTHQIADGGTQVYGRVKIASLEGSEIVDASGNEVWGVITCSARTTGGTYVLRFFSGTWGDVCTPYSMTEGFLFSYRQIFDLDDMPTWGDESVFVDKGAAALAPGQVDATLLASDAVTTAKIADGAVTAAKLASGIIGSGSLESAVKNRIGGGWDAVTKFVGDGTTDTFDLGHADVDFDEESVLVVADGIVLEITEDFTFSSNSGTGGVDQIVFVSAPVVDVRVAVRYRRTSL